MDSLALLCNLHGDGPATLAGLRELGCFELFEVLGLEPASLEVLFEGNARIAERFGREAVLLAERLGETMEVRAEASAEPTRESRSEPAPLPLEEVAASPDIEQFAPAMEAASAQVLTPFPALARGGPESAALLGIEPLPAPELPREAPAADDEAANGPVVKAVLDLWNRLDGREPLPSTPPSSDLAHAGIDGLTEELAEKLMAAGVHHLGGLLEANVLELSSATGVPYTKLAHLQFLGRKQLGPEQRDELMPVERPGQATMERTMPGSAPTEIRSSPEPAREPHSIEPMFEPQDEPLAEDGPAGPFA